jgi:hypothetical protein
LENAFGNGCGFTLIPVPSTLDIRGWGNASSKWTGLVFYEYIANILYALFVRKFSKNGSYSCLSCRMCISSSCGNKSKWRYYGGWSLNSEQMHIGFARMMYPFLQEYYFFRMGKLIK